MTEEPRFADHEFDNEALRTIVLNMPVMVSVFDASGRLLRANPEWERVLGWTVHEAQEVDVLAQLYPDPLQHQQALEFIRRAENRWQDFVVRTRNGRTIDVSWARFALSDGSRLGFGVEITERKRAEAERVHLLDSERRARTKAEQTLERLRAIQSITDSDPLESLTPRQREILQLVAEGHTSKEIAQRLELSVKTVEGHRAQLMERLGLRDVAGLVRFAVRVGLVPHDH